MWFICSFIHSLFWVSLVFPLMPSGSSITINSECSPSAVLHVTHDFLWFYRISLQFPLFWAEAPVAWVAFTSLFPTFVYSSCLPCIYSPILYFWEMHEMCVLHVAPTYPPFCFLFFPNTSSCKKRQAHCSVNSSCCCFHALDPPAVTKELVCW